MITQEVSQIWYNYLNIWITFIFLPSVTYTICVVEQLVNGIVDFQPKTAKINP